MMREDIFQTARQAGGFVSIRRLSGERHGLTIGPDGYSSKHNTEVRFFSCDEDGTMRVPPDVACTMCIVPGGFPEFEVVREH